MNGSVDERNRALEGELVEIVAWVDTAFDGYFVFPRHLIRELELESLAKTEAILADGSKVVLETFVCFVNWFGECLPVGGSDLGHQN